MHILRRSVLILLTLLAATPAVVAQERPPRPERPAQAKPEEAHGAGVLRLLPADAVSDKEITLGGGKIAYTATAGTLSLFDQTGEKSAAVFYTAYVAKNADATRRPITFAFNGGPGAASAYLNLGLAGPRIVDFGPDGRDGAAAKLVDNPDSWLAFTDLVMIDPIGTGWSRTAKPDDAKGFSERPRRRQRVRQGDRALCRQEQPRGLAEISARRKLRRLPRRQGRRRLAERPGHRRQRHRHGVAAARNVVPVGQLAIRARRRAAISDTGRDRAGAHQEIHAGGVGRGRALCHDRLSDHAGRPAADRRQGQGVLRPDRRADRHCRSRWSPRRAAGFATPISSICAPTA